MKGGDGVRPASPTCRAERPGPGEPPTVVVGTTRPPRGGLAAAGCKEGVGWLGSLGSVGPAFRIHIRNCGAEGGGCFWPELWEEGGNEWGRQKIERLGKFSVALLGRSCYLPRGWC